MGFHELRALLKRGFSGSKDKIFRKKQAEEEQKKIIHELQIKLNDQSKILQHLEVTLEEKISAGHRLEVNVDQLKEENEMLRNAQEDLKDKVPSSIGLQRNFKRMDGAINNLELQIKDEQNISIDLQSEINRLQDALGKQKVEIAQLQESLADNASRFIVQDANVERILSMVTDLRAEFTDEQNKINRLEIASVKQNNKVNVNIKEVKRTLEMVSDLKVEFRDNEIKNKVMQIFVQTLKGHTVTMKVKASSTIEKVRARIAEIEGGCPPHKLRIIFGGKQLNQLEQTLSHYNVQEVKTKTAY